MFFSLVLTSCQKTQDEVSQQATERVEVYRQDGLPNELQELANQGVADAQFNLGVMYGQGRGVRQDNDIAKEWVGKSCDNGLQKGCSLYKHLN